MFPDPIIATLVFNSALHAISDRIVADDRRLTREMSWAAANLSPTQSPAVA